MLLDSRFGFGNNPLLSMFDLQARAKPAIQSRDAFSLYSALLTAS